MCSARPAPLPGAAVLAGQPRLGAGDEDAALESRLRRDHWPPVPGRLLPAATQAVKLARADRWDDPVIWSPGVRLTAGQLVALLCLDDLVPTSAQASGREEKDVD